MNEPTNGPGHRGQTEDQQPAHTWGPWLFAATLVATLGFFWWLVIYSHGGPSH